MGAKEGASFASNQGRDMQVIDIAWFMLIFMILQTADSAGQFQSQSCSDLALITGLGTGSRKFPENS
jgi:hypothetical protein